MTYNDFIDKIAIGDLLTDAGYILNKKDGFKYPTYSMVDSLNHRIKGDKYVVNPVRNTCFQPPIYKNYNVISFIKEHPTLFADYNAGMNLDHLVNLVCNRLLNQPIDRSSHQTSLSSIQVKNFNIKDYDLIDFKKYDFENIKKFYPYFINRRININTQKAFAHHFYLASLNREDGKHIKNISFPLRIPGHTEKGRLKDIVGFEERGRVRLDGTSGYKGKARGSNSSEGLWIASPNDTSLKTATKVLWFESAYDAMAYYQLHIDKDNSLNDAVFLSSGGNPTVMQFRGVIATAKSAKHYLCFDNDMAGNQFAVNFKTEYENVKQTDLKLKAELQDYTNSLTNPNEILSGEPMLLPEKLRKAYAAWEAAEIEWNSMKQGGGIHPDDLKYQADKAIQFKNEYKTLLEATLSPFSASMKREIPEKGCKDWNDLVIKEAIQEDSQSEDETKTIGGVDLNNDGVVSSNESDQRKVYNCKR